MQASPGSSTYVGATPRTPDDGAIGTKLGALRHKTQEDQLKERKRALMERVRRHGARKKNGNAYEKPMTAKDASCMNELVRIRELHGVVSLGSLGSLRALGRSNDAESLTPDYKKLIKERNHIYQQNLKRTAIDIKKRQTADAYIDFLVGYEESEWPQHPMPNPPSQKVDPRGKSNQLDPPLNPITLAARYVESTATHHNDIRERLDYAHAKTVISLVRTGNQKNKTAQEEARLKAEKLDQIPLTFEAWKNLDEARRARIGRFFQLPDEKKDTEVRHRRWIREDAMALYELYKNEPEFHAAADSAVAKRVTTDPRRRPTLSNPPASVVPK